METGRAQEQEAPAALAPRQPSQKRVREGEAAIREKGIATCRLCGKTCTALSGLLSHVRTVHPDHTLRSVAETNLPVPHVIFEDSQLAVCVKPSGIETSKYSHTDCMALLTAIGDGALGSVQPVHRLDEATEGCLVLAKTVAARSSLQQAFANQLVKKRYRAILAGQVGDGKTLQGLVDEPISGKPSQTRWCVARSDSCTLPQPSCLTTVDFWPTTGRKHQLRRHSAEHLGVPIIGDRRYLSRTAVGVGSPPLMLWAAAVELPHPTTGETLSVDAGLEPLYFEQYRRDAGAVVETDKPVNSSE